MESDGVIWVDKLSLAACSARGTVEVYGSVTFLDQGLKVGIHGWGGGIAVTIIDMHRYDYFVVGVCR